MKNKYLIQNVITGQYFTDKKNFDHVSSAQNFDNYNDAQDMIESLLVAYAEAKLQLQIIKTFTN